MSPEEYRDMFERQEGFCAICQHPQGERALAVDHNHETNQIRGLLCDRCNRGIGYFRDDPELLIEASIYLRHFQSEAENQSASVAA